MSPEMQTTSLFRRRKTSMAGKAPAHTEVRKDSVYPELARVRTSSPQLPPIEILPSLAVSTVHLAERESMRTRNCVPPPRISSVSTRIRSYSSPYLLHNIRAEAARYYALEGMLILLCPFLLHRTGHILATLKQHPKGVSEWKDCLEM
jgi:hypothetical protein